MSMSKNVKDIEAFKARLESSRESYDDSCDKNATPRCKECGAQKEATEAEMAVHTKIARQHYEDEYVLKQEMLAHPYAKQFVCTMGLSACCSDSPHEVGEGNHEFGDRLQAAFPRGIDDSESAQVWFDFPPDIMDDLITYLCEKEGFDRDKIERDQGPSRHIMTYRDDEGRWFTISDYELDTSDAQFFKKSLRINWETALKCESACT